MDDIFKDENNVRVDFIESPTDNPPDAAGYSMHAKKDEFLGMASEFKENKGRLGLSKGLQKDNTDQRAPIGQPLVETEAKTVQPTKESSIKMPSEFESVRKRLLAEFSKGQLEDINTDRVETFIRQEGLEVKPFIVFERKDLQKVTEIVGNTGLLRSALNLGASGLYSPEMDMVLVLRDEDIEKSSGAIYTEGVLTHELAHASSMYQDYVGNDDKGYYTPRVGFCFPHNKSPWGWLLEEGWADMHRADYFAQNASDDQKEKLEKALKCGKVDMNDTIPHKPETTGVLPLPIKYLYVLPDGKPTTMSAAFAGYALELLCKKDPSIKPLLVEARSSVEGLRKLSQAIEKIKPGLYVELQKSDYTDDSFYKKLAYVVSNIANGTENPIKAEGPLRDKWNDRLSEK